MVIMWQMQLLPLEVRHLKDKMYFLKTFHSLRLIVARSVFALKREKLSNAGFVSMTANFNNLVPSTCPFVQWNQGRRPGHELIVYHDLIIYLNHGRVYRSAIIKFIFSHRDSGTRSPADMVLYSVTSSRSSGAKAFFIAHLNWSLCPQVLLIWENQKAANWQSSSTLLLWWRTSTLHWQRQAQCIILQTVREKRTTNYLSVSNWESDNDRQQSILYG